MKAYKNIRRIEYSVKWIEMRRMSEYGMMVIINEEGSLREFLMVNFESVI